MSEPLDPQVLDDVNQALFAGRLIEAIKIYRTATACGLKEAKDFVEALEARLRQETPESFTVPPRTVVQIRPGGCGLILVVIAILIGVLVLWLN